MQFTLVLPCCLSSGTPGPWPGRERGGCWAGGGRLGGSWGAGLLRPPPCTQGQPDGIRGHGGAGADIGADSCGGVGAGAGSGAGAGAADDAVVDFPFTSNTEAGRELEAQDRAASSMNTGSA